MFCSHKLLCAFLVLVIFSCADDQTYLHNSIKRASDAIIVPCDPHGLNTTHTCIVFASTYLQKLVIYDATAEEWVLAPNPFFALNVSVGPATHKLAKVTSANSKFPYFLALDQALPALFTVHAFPNNNNKTPSFFTPQAQELDKTLRPYQIAAWQGDTHVFVVLSYRDDKSIGILALDPITGIRDPQIKPLTIPLGQKPSHIAIDAERNFALISDEGASVLHKLDLTNIKNILLNPANAPTHISTINTDIAGDKIYLQKRDFGDGLKNYIALLNTPSKELRLINIDDNIIAKKKLDELPQAAYFPDEKSAPCCDNNKNWLALADIKGRLFYYLIKSAKNILSLKEASAKPVDMLAEKNFALSQLQLSTIVGGQVLVDPSLKKPEACRDNRKMFYIASFGTDRPRSWSSADVQEVEAQGYSCEGEEETFRFGYKHE